MPFILSLCLNMPFILRNIIMTRATKKEKLLAVKSQRVINNKMYHQKQVLRSEHSIKFEVDVIQCHNEAYSMREEECLTLPGKSEKVWNKDVFAQI